MTERRHAPRHSLEWPVELRAPDSRVYPAEMTDISTMGMGLALSRSAVVALAQGGGILTPGDRLRVECLPFDGGILARGLVLDCRTRYVRRLAFDRYHVGALFIGLDELQSQGLADLLGVAETASPLQHDD